MHTAALVAGSARAVGALHEAVPGLVRSVDRQALAGAVARGHFRPSEEEPFVAWFARLLSVREALWQVIADVSEPVDGDLRRIEARGEWRLLLLGYAAACLLVRLDRLLVEDVARERLVQRKLDEGSRELRIPRKQFTAVYRSLSEPQQAWQLLQAMRLVERRRARIEELAEDPDVGGLVRDLRELEAALDPDKGRFLDLLRAYGEHALRRRGRSARDQIAFAALETGGRLVAELHDRWRPTRIDEARRAELARLLEPGDVLVTRRELSLSNLFLPGFWPHAALYVGSESDRERLGVEVDPQRRSRWSGERCVLEALKDGVLFRPLAETLAVDAVAVLRPRLTSADLARGLARAACHEGKPYNFDFDFERSDRLVCTEVVYRAYDGLGDVRFELRERAGRLTLSAEDLLDAALEGRGLEPVAVFGAPPDPGRLRVGSEAKPALAASYR